MCDAFVTKLHLLPRALARPFSADKLGFLARMKVGVAKEIKTDEYRVALTPAGARELVQQGHEVLVETGAGDGSAFADADVRARSAPRIVSVDEVWGDAELLLKVKEPIEPEYARLREGLVLFTYLHIAADEPLTRALAESGIAASPTRRSRPTTAGCRCSRR